MPDAFKSGRTPEDFIREIFAEDFAGQEYDNQLAAEALQYEEE